MSIIQMSPTEEDAYRELTKLIYIQLRVSAYDRPLTPEEIDVAIDSAKKLDSMGYLNDDLRDWLKDVDVHWKE